MFIIGTRLERTMVHIDTRYRIPAHRDAVWAYLTDPSREAEYGWALNGGGNEIIERRPDGVRFRGGRDRTTIGRRSFLSTFDGAFHKDRYAIDWRILEGFEAGSRFTEELIETPDGTEVHVFGTIKLTGVDWDQRLAGIFLPRKARATVERNLCRDYKALKTLLATKMAAPAET
jgi:hypothetical protein